MIKKRTDGEEFIALLEINNELSLLDSFDELCRRAVYLARTRLGFDRVSIWFTGENPNEIVGSYGTDENGKVRDERGSRVYFNNTQIASQVRSLSAPKVLKREGTLYDNRGRQVGRGTWACSVLWSGNKNIGYIIIDNLFSGKPVNTRLLALFAATFGHLYSLKKTRESLKKSEERYRELWDEAPVAYHTLDTRGIITSVNKTEAAMLGYRPEEMLNRPIFDFIIPEQRREARRRFAVKIAGKSIRKADNRIYLRKHGTPIIVHIEDKQERDHSGRITGIRTTMVDITDQRNAEKVVERLAYSDHVTGLPNRIYFNDRLARQIRHAESTRRRFAVILLDLDYFKRINDTLGHMAGDRLLQEVGKRLAGLLRRGDTVARMGGDEFLILLPDAHAPSDIGAISKKILDVLFSPFRVGKHSLRTTASLGAAFFPDDGKDGETLLKNADIAMYEAKKAGRNTWRPYKKPSSMMKKSRRKRHPRTNS